MTLGLALMAMYALVGVSAFAGVGAMAVLMVFTLVMVKKENEMERAILEAEDDRVELTT